MLTPQHGAQKCLDNKFEGVSDTRERAATSGRTMRVAKILKPCPTCKVDLADFLRTAPVNIDMAGLIDNLQKSAGGAAEDAAKPVRLFTAPPETVGR